MLKLYENIRAKRLELGLSQTQLAELIGYKDKTAISRIERGLVDIPQSKLELFARALKTTPGDLMGTTETVEDQVSVLLGSLNKEGQDKVLEYITDLVASGRYSVKCSESEVV